MKKPKYRFEAQGSFVSWMKPQLPVSDDIRTAWRVDLGGSTSFCSSTLSRPTEVCRVRVYFCDTSNHKKGKPDSAVKEIDMFNEDFYKSWHKNKAIFNNT